MALYEGWDPTIGRSGGYALGSQQGGPDPNAGRDAIVTAMLSQQGMSPPQAQQGYDMAMGPDQGQSFQTVNAGGGGRQMLGDQGWSMQGNNIYDPSGALVSSAGLQQYGQIPGYYQPTSAAQAAPKVLDPRTIGSSLSGGMVGAGIGPGAGQVGGYSDATGQVGPIMGDFNDQGYTSYDMGRGAPQGWSDQQNPSLASPGVLGWGGGGSMLGNAQTAVQPGGFGPQPSIVAQPGAPLGQPGGWPSGRTAQQGPNLNDPGDQAALAAQSGSQGWGGDFGGYSPNAGGWGGFGDFGGFSGSGFNSSGDYSGGYDTAAGNVG